MQIDDVPTASRLVQAIDVLRDELCDPPAALEVRQRIMRLVRACAAHAAEAGKTPRPVALAGEVASDERLDHDRGAALPFARGVAVIRNA